MFTAEEIQIFASQWSKTVPAVRSHIQKFLLDRYEISESGNRYSFYILIIRIHVAGVDVSVKVYDHYEGYWMLEDRYFVSWEQLKR